MKLQLFSKYLLLLVLPVSSTGSADTYTELSPALVSIDTPAANTRPIMADFRLGYEIPGHQFELAFMTSIQDDSLNQLDVDIPSVFSIFYHFIPVSPSSIKFHLILGASQVNVDSSYPTVADSSDKFNGVSFGVGFEEAFKSNPRLKMSVDLIRLYDGDEIKINATSLGVHYVF